MLRGSFPKPILIVTLLALALGLLASRHAGAVGGATFTVNDFNDAVDAHPGDGVCAAASGKCTLRAAVQEANAHPGADTIIVPASTFKLTIPGVNEDKAATGDLDITDEVTITGAGSAKTVIDANGLDRAFDIYPGHTVGTGVTLSGLTIRNGVAEEGAGILDGAPLGYGGTVTLTDLVVSANHATFGGGGIANDGLMVISNSVITGNQAASGNIGGGISNFGNMTITDTTITGNSADMQGGGLFNGLGELTITGSTFSANTAGHEGGGIANQGGKLTMTNTTFNGNGAVDGGGAIYSGAIGSQVTLTNVTLAGDAAPTAREISHDTAGPFHVKSSIIAGAAPGSNCSGTLDSDGHNISSDATCGLTHLGDKQSTNPKLGPLADNGGPTQTRALLEGSPAIDAGGGDCPPPATDQRGVLRPQGPACDAGAFELAPQPSPTPTSSPTPTATPPAGGQIWGDVRCDGAVEATDALGDLRYVAALSPISQTEPCPHIGDSVDVRGFSPHLWGDVNCTGAVDAVDALMILRFVAGLSTSKTPPCPDIGATVVIS